MGRVGRTLVDAVFRISNNRYAVETPARPWNEWRSHPMPMLLEDLATETSASNRRAAKRLDEEVRSLDDSRQPLATPEKLRQKAIESARQATEFALACLHQAESYRNLMLLGLAEEPLGENAERLLRTVIELYESGNQLIRSPRLLWERAEKLGASAAGREELDQAERRFGELIAEATRALDHRINGWQPADPERLALGLQQAREGKTVKAEDARSWFRRSSE